MCDIYFRKIIFTVKVFTFYLSCAIINTSAWQKTENGMIDFNIIEKNYTEHNRKRVEDGYFLGSICGIWDAEKKLFGSTEGFSRLDKSEGIREDSIFRLASMTKPITGCAFMQLFEKGLVDLDTPVSEFIPEFKEMQVAVKIENDAITETEEMRFQITPRMILSHSSGIGSGSSGVIQAKGLKKQLLLKDTVSLYSSTVLDFQPGTKQAYSATWAFDVLARVIEIISGMQYGDYLRKNIFEPLGMSDTTYLPTDEQLTRVVDFCARTESGFRVHGISPRVGFGGLCENSVCGGAGLFSSLGDYSKFARMLLRGGELDGARILEKSSVDLMRVNQTVNTPSGKTETTWGLSMFVRRENDFLPTGAFGWSGAYGTHFWVDTKRGIACVYMMNLSNAGGAGEPAAHEFERDVMSGIK